MKVLIVDDYRSHGESLVELVQVLGHEAQYAPSYSEASWLLDLYAFDLALLDFDMPRMTGPMIASELARRFPNVRPVIMSARPPDKRRSREIGKLMFLQKPLRREQLEALFIDLVREQGGCGLMLRASFPILRVDDLNLTAEARTAEARRTRRRAEKKRREEKRKQGGDPS